MRWDSRRFSMAMVAGEGVYCHFGGDGGGIKTSFQDDGFGECTVCAWGRDQAEARGGLLLGAGKACMKSGHEIWDG